MSVLPQNVCKMQNIIELMVENCAKEVYKGWGATSVALQKLKISSCIIYDVLNAKQADNVFSKKEIRDLAFRKFAQLRNGEPFVRTVLSGLWFIKISMDPMFRQDLSDACKLEGNARKERFELISNEYFDDDVIKSI